MPEINVERWVDHQLSFFPRNQLVARYKPDINRAELAAHELLIAILAPLMPKPSFNGMFNAIMENATNKDPMARNLVRFLIQRARNDQLAQPEFIADLVSSSEAESLSEEAAILVSWMVGLADSDVVAAVKSSLDLEFAQSQNFAARFTSMILEGAIASAR